MEDLIKGKICCRALRPAHAIAVPGARHCAARCNGDVQIRRWLARDHALTVLPAVSSLKALRRVARPSAATKPMIGFGNPLLDGDQAIPKYDASQDARNARPRKPKLPRETTPQRLASLFGSRRGVTPMAVRGLADVDFIRITPLPETADELCAVARDLNADPGEIRLGARATEREVKRLSASGQLAQYRIVHFATHGVLAGQVTGTGEPGLLLTPPDSPSEEDDGYLTASEIAALKLDADWVILSACNTAAGGATGAEALSGLARAFIYAQARALLVSHWEVNSAATVAITTGAMPATNRGSDTKVGRAEALRRVHGWRLSLEAGVSRIRACGRHSCWWAMGSSEYTDAESSATTITLDAGMLVIEKRYCEAPATVFGHRGHVKKLFRRSGWPLLDP